MQLQANGSSAVFSPTGALQAFCEVPCGDGHKRRCTVNGKYKNDSIPAYVQVCYKGRAHTVSGKVRFFTAGSEGAGYYFAADSKGKNYFAIANSILEGIKR